MVNLLYVCNNVSLDILLVLMDTFCLINSGKFANMTTLRPGFLVNLITEMEKEGIYRRELMRPIVHAWTNLCHGSHPDS